MADGATAATAYAIGWEPQPGPQTALLACPVFEVFFGGARGGGKTDGMLGEWASHADLYGKNAVGLMVRRERVQLLETIEATNSIGRISRQRFQLSAALIPVARPTGQHLTIPVSECKDISLRHVVGHLRNFAERAGLRQR